MKLKVRPLILRALILALAFSILACEPDETPPQLELVPAQNTSDEIHLAGAGEATSLVRHLAQVFTARSPGPAIIVHDPVGSSGGLSALQSGLLDGALIAEALKGRGAPSGIRIAFSEVVIALGSGIENRQMSVEEFVQTLSGSGGAWTSGLSRRFFLKSVKEPSLDALAFNLPVIEKTLANRDFQTRWTRVQASEAIGERVARTPGSLAIVDLGNLRLRSAPVWISRLDGVAPVFIELRLITGTAVSPRLQSFLEFITGPDGRALVNDLGFQSVVPG